MASLDECVAKIKEGSGLYALRGDVIMVFARPIDALDCKILPKGYVTYAADACAGRLTGDDVPDPYDIQLEEFCMHDLILKSYTPTSLKKMGELLDSLRSRVHAAAYNDFPARLDQAGLVEVSSRKFYHMVSLMQAELFRTCDSAFDGRNNSKFPAFKETRASFNEFQIRYMDVPIESYHFHPDLASGQFIFMPSLQFPEIEGVRRVAVADTIEEIRALDLVREGLPTSFVLYRGAITSLLPSFLGKKPESGKEDERISILTRNCQTPDELYQLFSLEQKNK